MDCILLQNVISSPLGLVPKSGPGKFRIFHDLSNPKDNSVNSGIPREMPCVQYDNADHIISLIKHYGPGSLMTKTDIQDAFRIILIHPFIIISTNKCSSDRFKCLANIY